MYGLVIYQMLGNINTDVKGIMKVKDMAYLTARELTERWRNRIAIQTLANWRNQGKGPPHTKIGARVLYPLDKLEQWESEQLNQVNVAVNDNEQK